MSSRRTNKIRVNFQFELTLEELNVPLAIQHKIPSSSGFYIVWKRGQDKPIESKKCVSASGAKMKWSEPEVLKMECLLIKQKHSDEYMSKQSRLLLKQIHTDKHTHSTVGVAKLDFKDFLSKKENVQSIDIPFTKCNVPDIYVNATMRITVLDDEKSDKEDSISVMSTRTVDIEQMTLNDDDSVTLPELPAEQSCPTEEDTCLLIGKRQSVDVLLHDSKEDEYVMKEKRNPSNKTPYNDDSHSNWQWAQKETKWRMQQQESNDLKSQIEEMDGKYRTLLSKCKELESEKKTQQLDFEKERNMLKIEISEMEDKLNNNLFEIKTLKAENAQMQDLINRTSAKWCDLTNVLTASKNELHGKIAELCRQNEDLEMTLVMIRNSWTQTAHVMENEVNKNSTKMERLANEAKSNELKYESLERELQMKQEMIDNLQQCRLQMDTQINNLELKYAAQSVENARVNTHCNVIQSKLTQLRKWIFELAQQGIIKFDTQQLSITQDNIFDVIEQQSIQNTCFLSSKLDHFKDHHDHTHTHDHHNQVFANDTKNMSFFI